MEYKCSICGLHYSDKELARKCHEWCQTHSSCNLQIARQSFEAKGEKGAE